MGRGAGLVAHEDEHLLEDGPLGDGDDVLLEAVRRSRQTVFEAVSLVKVAFMASMSRLPIVAAEGLKAGVEVPQRTSLRAVGVSFSA